MKGFLLAMMVSAAGLPAGAAELPLWDLPTGPDDTPRLTALSKDRLLPLYPVAWRPR